MVSRWGSHSPDTESWTVLEISNMFDILSIHLFCQTWKIHPTLTNSVNIAPTLEKYLVTHKLAPVEHPHCIKYFETKVFSRSNMLTMIPPNEKIYKLCTCRVRMIMYPFETKYCTACGQFSAT